MTKLSLRLRQASEKISEALVLLGQHEAHCRNPRDPERAPLELIMLKQSLEAVREVVDAALKEGRAR